MNALHRLCCIAGFGIVFFNTTGCDVRVKPTPHKKELQEERRLRASLPVADAAVVETAEKTRKTVTVAMKRDPRHLNPALRISRWGYRVAMYTIFEPLVKRNPRTYALEPCLASSWSISPDGRTYTFTIRKDVQWHDGRPLTAQDVRYSLTRVVDGRSPLGPFRDDIRGSYKRVDVSGPHEVRLVLRTANAFLLDHIAEYPILPKHVFRQAIYPGSRGSQRPVGTGPFRFDSRKKGEEILLRANNNYWGRVPDIHKLRFRLVEDWGKALTFLKRGDIDILPDMIRQHYPSQLTPRVKKHFREVSFKAPGFSYILWNTRHKILKDFRVRRAFTMLIDRKRLIREVHHGLARVIAGPYWRPLNLGDPELEPWPFDPIKARNLLDKAGWRDRDGDKIRDKDGEPMRVVLMQPVGADELKAEMKIISAEFAKSGIELVQVPTDWPMMQRRLVAGRFTAAALRWAGRPAEDLSMLFHSAGKKNFGVIANLMLDKLLIRLRVTRNRKKRGPKSAQIEQVLHSYQPCTFLHAPVRIALVHRRLKNVHFGPDWFDFSAMRVTPPPPSKKQSTPVTVF
jgi:peptide/nickel transport system substrate-binding protein